VTNPGDEKPPFDSTFPQSRGIVSARAKSHAKIAYLGYMGRFAHQENDLIEMPLGNVRHEKCARKAR
jgi:hypothetical protein